MNICQENKSKVNEWLRLRGVTHGIDELYDEPDLSPYSVPELIELFKCAPSFTMRRIVAAALFARKPSPAQKREAVEAILTVVRENPGRYSDLSILVLNELANNISTDKAHEIGEMTFDKRYGHLRADFTQVLYKIGNAEAISFLIRAAKEPVTAALALAGLAKLNVPEAVTLCEDALKDPAILHKDAIKETHSKLKRKLAKKTVHPLHVTKEPVPDGLEEWSANLDGAELPKLLRGIQKCVERGFAKAEMSEMRSVADELSIDQTARLKFNVKFTGKETNVWLEIFCDDENAYDLSVFGPEDLVRTIDKTLEKYLS